MTNDHSEGKYKKLKLPSKLTLSKPVDSQKLKSSYLTSRNSNITVEIKNSKPYPGALLIKRSAIDVDTKTSSTVGNDFSEKINILKRAASFAKSEESKNSFSTPLTTPENISDVNTANVTSIDEDTRGKNESTSADVSISTIDITALHSNDKDTSEQLSDVTEQQESKDSKCNIDNIEGSNFESSKSNVTKDDVVNIANDLAILQNRDTESAKSKSVMDTSIKEIDDKDIVTNNDVISKESATPQAKPVIARQKKDNSRKLRKADIYQMLDGDGDPTDVKYKGLTSIRRPKHKNRQKQSKLLQKIYREVVMSDNIKVSDLALRMSEKISDVVHGLSKLGMSVTAEQTIDIDTAELIAVSLGHSVKKEQKIDVDTILQVNNDAPDHLVARAPVVTVMGHVDHGKTSLLDTLRLTNVVASESGGITQHIGAYKTILDSNKSITFIDTPGHEAFSEIRTRGAQVTDIIVLVIAADDGIKPQTIEAIKHAQVAKVPIIVAINKIDKPNANPDKIKNELLLHNIVPEELGGDTIVVPISVLQKTNLDKLKESILLLAELLELKANPNIPASGSVIESKIDSKRGVVATVLVQQGTLRIGNVILAGQCFGKVKSMINDHNQRITHAYPSDPIQVLGFNKVPSAGDAVSVVQSEKQARCVIEYRLSKQKEAQDLELEKRGSPSLEELLKNSTQDKAFKELTLIVKADVHGSLEAIISSINKIVSDEVKIKIIHSAVGHINESDVILAKASNALILGFSVSADATTTVKAEKSSVIIQYHSIIYNLIDSVKGIVSGMLSPIIHHEYTGSAEVRAIFDINKIGKIAGCYVNRGFIQSSSAVKLLRENKVIYEGSLQTLKRFKDHVKEAKEGFECGIELSGFSDIEIGDIIQAFTITEEKPQL